MPMALSSRRQMIRLRFGRPGFVTAIGEDQVRFVSDSSHFDRPCADWVATLGTSTSTSTSTRA
jgi:hypothetical protein